MSHTFPKVRQNVVNVRKPFLQVWQNVVNVRRLVLQVWQNVVNVGKLVLQVWQNVVNVRNLSYKFGKMYLFLAKKMDYRAFKRFGRNLKLIF